MSPIGLVETIPGDGKWWIIHHLFQMWSEGFSTNDWLQFQWLPTVFIQNWWWLLLWVTSLYIYFILAFLQCHPHLISAICLLFLACFVRKIWITISGLMAQSTTWHPDQVLSGLLAFGQVQSGPIRSARIWVRVQSAAQHPDQPASIQVRWDQVCWYSCQVQLAVWHPDSQLASMSGCSQHLDILIMACHSPDNKMAQKVNIEFLECRGYTEV